MRGNEPDLRSTITIDAAQDRSVAEYASGKEDRVRLGEIEGRFAGSAMILYASNEEPYGGAVELSVEAARMANAEEGWLGISIQGDSDTRLAMAGLMMDGFIHQVPGSESMVERDHGLGQKETHQILEMYFKPDETAKTNEANREETGKMRMPVQTKGELVSAGISESVGSFVITS